MDYLLTQHAHLPSADSLPEHNRETMDSFLTQNSDFPSADLLPEDKVFHELAAMRQIVEPRLLRLESEIRSLVKLSFSVKEALERIEQQQGMMLVRFERKRVCDIDDHAQYLRDEEGSNTAYLHPKSLALEFVEQPLARPSEESEDRSMQRGFLNMQTALVLAKDMDSSICTERQPLSAALEDIEEDMARPCVETDHVSRLDKLIVGHGEPKAIPPIVNQDEIVSGLRAEHVQLQDVDLPNSQESLRKVLREEFKNHEVSVIQQLTTLQNCGTPVMDQSAEGEIQQESVENLLTHQTIRRQDSQASHQGIETSRNPLAPLISPELNDPTSAPPQTTLYSENQFMETAIRKQATFDEWFIQCLTDDSCLPNISLKDDSSFAGVFIHDRSLIKPAYHMEDHFKTTGWVQALVRSDAFRHFTTIMVCLNALWVGIAQDHNPVLRLYDSRPVFIIAENLFCVFFTIELILRFIAFNSSREALLDGWFRFDLFLVATMVTETWGFMVAMQLMDFQASRLPIAPFRTLRLLKLTRMARLMHAFSELKTMIRSLLRAVIAVASMCIFLLLILYVWGIIMHTLLKDEAALNKKLRDDSQMDFTALNNSMWILFLNGALLLDNAAPLLTLLVFGDTFKIKCAGVLLLVFVFLSAFLVLQMLTGIFCDVVIQVREEHRNENDIRLIKQELSAMLAAIDDGDGKLTQQEVLAFISHGNTKSVVIHMGINLVFLYQLQEILFDRQKKIKIRDFLELVLLCRSSNHATVETMAGGFCFLGKEIARLQKRVTQDIRHSTETQDSILMSAKKISVGNIMSL